MDTENRPAVAVKFEPDSSFDSVESRWSEAGSGDLPVQLDVPEKEPEGDVLV